MLVQELVGDTEASHGQDCRPAAMPGQLSHRARVTEATVSAWLAASSLLWRESVRASHSPSSCV